MENEHQSMPIVVTRTDLYRLVWSIPLVRLAARYKTTTDELSAAYARMKVPRPGSGHWLKKSTGKSVMQEELPRADQETMLETTISAPHGQLLPMTAQSEFENKRAITRARYDGISVPDDIVHPHPVIERWLADHERKRKETSLFRPKPFTELDHRRFRFLDTLFKTLIKIGFEVRVGELDRVYLSFDGERIDFTLRERQRQVRVPLDDKRYKAWTKELRPTGDLVFKIMTWLPPEIPTAWRDDARTPLEWQLADIVAVLSLVGPRLVRERTVKAAEQKRRWDEEQRLRLIRDRREQDDKRWRKMLEFAQQRDLAESVRRLLVDLESADQPEGTFGGLTSYEWLACVRQWLERFDPLMREPKSLYEELAAIRP